MGDAARVVRYHVIGMDCANDAAEIEEAVRGIGGVQQVKVSTATQVMSLRAHEPAPLLTQIEEAVGRLGYQLQRMDDVEPVGGDDDELPKGMARIPAGYKRALWIVVLLNVGYGVVEMVGGFISGSQALKADALDFVGDGLITFLALLAMSWSLRWRARSALIQGLFLGALGLSVLVTTAYRVLVQNQPEAELMGVIGLGALIVNVAAAVVLIPHRTGDANAKAVWLFSRNDALGNVAVIIAAGLVGWLDSAWPDLAVAVVIAGLFLHSSWAIVRDARADLRDA